MNLAQLQTFLNQNEIPVVKQQVGFLEIIKKSHSETVNSAIYAHFLSCDISLIKYAFLDTLISLIEEKTNKKLMFSGLQIQTEIGTTTGRLDMVLQDLVSLNTILIENKIYHKLDNDLKEYWDFFDVSDKIKVGVLLTLKPHAIPEDVQGKFINITHWEWISAVKQVLSPNDLDDNAYKLYLTDFYNTIENISTTYKMNESAKFFFENANKVNRTAITLHEGHNFLNAQYELIAAKLGLQSFGSDMNWRNFWDENNHIDTFLTVDAQDLVSGNATRFKIILELYRDDKKRVDELVKKFKSHPQFVDKMRGETKGLYCHILVKEYNISLSELEQFAEIVVSHIKNDFNQIFIEFVEYLYLEKDISSWKHNFNC